MKIIDLVAISVTTLCVGVLGLCYYQAMPKSVVYACSEDRADLPPDVAKLCKQLTKGLWWHI